MTIPAALSCKLTGSLRRFSTYRHDACSNIQIFDQFVHQSSARKPYRPSPVRELALFQAVASLRRLPVPSSATLKSP